MFLVVGARLGSGNAAARGNLASRASTCLAVEFGIFLAPFHQLGEDPTLALERDLELIQWLDYSASTKPGSASTTAQGGSSSPPPRCSSASRPSEPGTSSSAPASFRCRTTIRSCSPIDGAARPSDAGAGHARRRAWRAGNRRVDARYRAEPTAPAHGGGDGYHRPSADRE